MGGGEVAARRRRVIALTDPKDTLVPPPVQTGFVEQLRSAGKPVLQVKTEARGAEHHALIEKALFVTGKCVAGDSNEAIARTSGGTKAGDLPRWAGRSWRDAAELRIASPLAKGCHRDRQNTI
jgi:hypothetical protein